MVFYHAVWKKVFLKNGWRLQICSEVTLFTASIHLEKHLISAIRRYVVEQRQNDPELNETRTQRSHTYCTTYVQSRTVRNLAGCSTALVGLGQLHLLLYQFHGRVTFSKLDQSFLSDWPQDFPKGISSGKLRYCGVTKTSLSEFSQRNWDIECNDTKSYLREFSPGEFRYCDEPKTFPCELP